MTNRALPSPEILRQLLRYEPETGKLFWLERPLHLSQSLRANKIFNSRFVGEEAFRQVHPKGYLHGAIYAHTMRAHQVAWAIHHGYWAKQIDHINGIKADNRIANLREVTTRENCQNRPKRRDNTSGVNGVSWHRRIGKWHANIGLQGKHVSLGYFDTIEDAAEARRRAAAEHGFHPNHGREKPQPGI